MVVSIVGVQAHGISNIDGSDTTILTDAVGRTKISHAQSTSSVGTITASGQTVFVPMDSLSDLIWYFYGTHAGVNLTFEQSPDSTNGVNGNWFGALAKNQASTAVVATSTGVLATNSSTSFFVSAPGASYVRVRATAWTSGTLNVVGSGSTAARPTDVTAALSSNSVVVAAGTTNSIGKNEDDASASGHTGAAVLGVRVPTTPAAQTSAAGDYGFLAINAEGKLVVSVGAADELAWQSSPVTLTTTTSTSIKASAGAGLRNYLTDITIANTSATGVRVDILDGATVIRSFWAPATSTVWQTFDMALKGTAATALNAQLSAAVTDVRVSVNGYIGV